MLLEKQGEGNSSFSVRSWYYHLVVLLYLTERVLDGKEFVSIPLCFSILLALHPVIIFVI